MHFNPKQRILPILMVTISLKASIAIGTRLYASLSRKINFFGDEESIGNGRLKRTNLL